MEEKGAYQPSEKWQKTDFKIQRPDGKDIIYKQELKAGKHAFEAHSGKEGNIYGAPHACFIQGSKPDELKIQVGINSPIEILSEARRFEKETIGLKSGHWFFNDYNWNAVGSFVKHMPWDSKVLDLNESNYSKDARVLVFEKPNGKRTIVVSNRSGQDYTFQINTQLSKAKWKGYRYTPWERGKNTKGIKIGSQTGQKINTTLPHLSWEFWEEL